MSRSNDLATRHTLAATDIASGTFADARISSSSVAQHATTYDDKGVKEDIAMLGFYRAADHSKSYYSLVDQVIDTFTDQTGIDTGASTNEIFATGEYSSFTSTAGESISATGGQKANASSGGAGGTGTGGASQGTGGTGSTGTASSTSVGGAGTNTGGTSAAIGAGGGSGAEDSGITSAGGAGSAASYTGGGGAGASDNNTTNVGTLPLGGIGYKQGGTGSDNDTGADDGGGVGGDGDTYGGGDAGIEGTLRKNNGGGGGWPGGGGGGAAQENNHTSSSGSGANGGVIITYTNSGAQVITKYAVETNATYTIPAGSTDLVVWAVGGGGSGGYQSEGKSGGGGGGGVSKSNTFSDAAGRVITYTVGDGGASALQGNGNDGGTTSVTIGGANTYNDITLQSNDTEAEAQPTKADLVALVQDIGTGAATVNTHIKGWVSRDSGTTFTQGTLVDEGDWGTDKHRVLAFHDLDISGQPADKTMCYKITTHSSSAVYNTKIHATSFAWA